MIWVETENMDIIKLPKLVLIRPKEYKRVCKFLKVVQKHTYIRDCLKGNCECQCLSDRFRIVIARGSELEWTITMASQILKADAKIKKHQLGHYYTE